MHTVINGLKNFALLLRDALIELRRHQPLQIAGATSFFAVFALPPMLIILSGTFGIFAGFSPIKQGLLRQLSQAIDERTVREVGKAVANVQWLAPGPFTESAVAVFLLFVATTFFSVIRNSLDQLWNIQLKKNNSIAFMLGQRAKSLAAILFAGGLVLAVLATGTAAPSENENIWVSVVTVFMPALIASTTWFTIIFKFFADGRPAWRASIFGGTLAGLLFTIGKSVLRGLLSYHQVHTIYGASSAMVVLLLFVFYCALIFYYAACFVKVISERADKPIIPTSHAAKFLITRAPAS